MLPINVILIDDEPEAISRLNRLLTLFKEISILASATDPDQGIQKIMELQPDLVFMDVEMPGKSGFDVIEAVTAKGFRPKYIITTGYDHYILKALRSQAFDYLIKPVDVDELREMLKRFSQEQKSKKEKLESYLQSLANENGLSKRETEVLPYLLKGQQSQEIAESLFISKNTADTHRRSILHKLGMKDTKELMYKINILTSF